MTTDAAPSAGTTANEANAPARDPHKAAKRKKLIIGFLAIVVVVGLIAWVWKAFLAPKSETTNNAYTNVEVGQVTPLTGGAVKSISVVNTQSVQAGQVLFVLDDTDQRTMLAQAQAALEGARRKVRQVLANDENLAGQVAMRQADVQTAEANLVQVQAALEKANLDTKRRQVLAGPGAISAQELSDSLTMQRQAEAGLTQAQAKVREVKAGAAAATGARNANKALFDDSTIETNPEVLAAKAKVDAAQTDLDRTTVRAPTAGVIDQRKLAIGQRVQPGAPVMVVVPVTSMYVDANFKESQLRDVKPGQTAKVTSDLYGKKVVYHGRVQGFSGGSGSAFAAIPAQNATGNWIKVVQRLPTRITLDPKELQDHPLRVGLSMDVTVDTSGR